MEWLIGISVFLAISVYIVIRQKIENRRERIKTIRERFGKLYPDGNNNEHLKKLKEVPGYFDTEINNSIFEDFNTDELFLAINGTLSAVGEEYLYYSLHKPVYDTKELLKRNRLSEELKDLDNTMDLRYLLMSIKKYDKVNVIECIHNLKNVKADDTVFHIISLFIFLATFVMMFFLPDIGIFLCLMAACVNSVTYFKKKSSISGYINAMLILTVLIDASCKISEDILKNKPDRNSETVKQFDKIKNLSAKFGRFKNNTWLIAPKSEVESIFEILTDYLKFLTHIDIIKFNISVNNLKKYENELILLYKLFGELELALNSASVKAALPYYCVPEFDDKLHINSEKMYHPLLNNPVSNDCITDKCMLITGSNASGKSTYLRMIGLNVLLAQTLGFVCAENYSASLFYLTSSMKITDSILEGESYYMAEIRHIKEIIDYEGNIPLLLCIDEILRGTNTLERVAASSQILKYLESKNAIIIAATHDVELVELLKGLYENYYFCENIEDINNIFDYKIRKGTNYTNNAIRLLERCGYPSEILEESFKLCNQLKERE
ncbi:MAG: hypothetical protein PUB67_01595 [Clostridiales bacterium]|nr:hypothetical protein [Clostridiales bacterium]